MKSWTKLVIKWFVVGLLGLANAASAAGITTITNANTGKVSTAAVRADGVLFEWGAAMNRSTTPAWFGQNVSSISSDGGYVVQTDGSVLDLMNGNVVVPGLSPVQEVIAPPTIWLGATQRPSFAHLQNGGVKAIMTVAGMSGVQTFIQGFGMSGVTGVSVVPRESGLPNESWAWAVGSDGNLYDGRSTYTGIGISNVGAVVAGLSNVIGVASDLYNDTFVVKSDGTVWAWGPWVTSNGAYNATWGPAVAGTLSPVQVPGLANISSLALGSSWKGGSVYALTATGDVWAWGRDEYGQLGSDRISNMGFAQYPIKVPGLTNVAKIYTLHVSVLALTADGSVWGWGENYWGQLGDGSVVNRSVPVQVGGLSPLTGVTSLSLSDGLVSPNALTQSYPYSVAVKADGSVWTWGDNSVGQLGDGTRINRNAPVRVLGEGGIDFLTVQPAILTVLKNGAPLLTSPSFVFANQAVGTTSAAQTMTFTNVGLVTWTGFSFLPSVGDFAQTNNCGTSLAVGASCTINITFTPTHAGLQTVTSNLNMMGNSNLSGPGGMTLTGTGVGARAVMSSSLGFGTQKTTTTTTRTVTLTNAGSASLTVGTAGITGGTSMAFSVTPDNCTGQILAAGASCTMNVNFIPALAQAYAGTLTFTGSSNPGGAPSMALSGTGAATAATRGDFNANGTADILWRDMATGVNGIWLMNGATMTSAVLTYTVPTNWTVAGVLDFNGDAKSDILWRDTLTGTNVLWFMNGTGITSGSVINSATPDWSIAGTGDFNGDGQNDILWFNNITRQVAVWLMNSGQIVSAGFVGSVAKGWFIAGVGDFDGDGKADILWRNQSTGVNALWYMNGTSMQSSVAVTTTASNWYVAGIADFNGDGKADILWRDPLTGFNGLYLMNGNTILSGVLIPTASTIWSVAKVADFNGDGKADIMWRDTAGNNGIWLMNGTVVSSQLLTTSASTNWTVIKK